MISNDRYRNASFKYITEMCVSLIEPVKRQSWLSVVNYLRIERKRAAKYEIFHNVDPHEIGSVQ